MHGLTLIDLLMVIIVISLLITLLLPTLSSARTTARTTLGVSSHRMMIQAVQDYASDYKNHLPPGYRPTVGEVSGTDWAQVINGHMTKSSMVWTRDSKLSPIFRDLNAAIPKGKLHYSAHPKLMPDVSETFDRTLRIEDVRRAAESIAIVDGSQETRSGNAHSTAHKIGGGRFNPATADKPVPPGPNSDGPRGDPVLGRIRWRQEDGRAGNFSFLDGHVSTMLIGGVLQRHVRQERWPGD